jgi:hypothetical protein
MNWYDMGLFLVRFGVIGLLSIAAVLLAACGASCVAEDAFAAMAMVTVLAFLFAGFTGLFIMVREIIKEKTDVDKGA